MIHLDAGSGWADHTEATLLYTGAFLQYPRQTQETDERQPLQSFLLDMEKKGELHGVQKS